MLLTALSGAVANVGTPRELSELLIVFNGMAAMPKAPLNNPPRGPPCCPVDVAAADVLPPPLLTELAAPPAPLPPVAAAAPPVPKVFTS